MQMSGLASRPGDNRTPAVLLNRRTNPTATITQNTAAKASGIYVIRIITEVQASLR
jgi:hypothetical protein